MPFTKLYVYTYKQQSQQITNSKHKRITIHNNIIECIVCFPLPPSLPPSLPQLCCQCRIQPEAFLHFKQQLVAECDKTGRLRLAEARKLLKIDVNKTRRIYNLLLTKELIKCD